MADEKPHADTLGDVLAVIANCLELGKFSKQTPATRKDAALVANLICKQIETLPIEENRPNIWLLHAANPDGLDVVNLQQTFNERKFEDWLNKIHHMQAGTASALMFWFVFAWKKREPKRRQLSAEVKAAARRILMLSRLPEAGREKRFETALKNATDSIFPQGTSHLATVQINHLVDTIRENKAAWLSDIQGLYRVYRHRSDDNDDSFIAELFEIAAPKNTSFGFSGTYYEFGGVPNNLRTKTEDRWDCSGFVDNDLLHTSMSKKTGGNRIVHEQMQIAYPTGEGSPVMCGIRVGLTDTNSHLGVSIVLFENLAKTSQQIKKVAKGAVKSYAESRNGVFAIDPENPLHRLRHKALKELFAEAEAARLIMKKNTVFDFDAAGMAKDFRRRLGTHVGDPLHGEAK